MLSRCLNPRFISYPNYGARGISVCARWRKSFVAFLADVGPRPSPKHSLDRINNDGNYEPGNVRWATWRVQMRNMRKSAYYTYRGRRMCLTDWSQRLGITPSTLWWRLRHWSITMALSTPRAVAYVR